MNESLLLLNSGPGVKLSLQSHVQPNLEVGQNDDLYEKEADAIVDKLMMKPSNEKLQMNNEVGAQAFTHGNDIYFNKGKYNSSSVQGKHLMAPELTHTIPQNGRQPFDISSQLLKSGTKAAGTSPMLPATATVAIPYRIFRQTSGIIETAFDAPEGGEFTMQRFFHAWIQLQSSTGTGSFFKVY